MPGIAGYGGAVYYGAQTSTSFTNEAMTEQAGDNTNFIITDATKSMWDDTATTTIQKDTAGNGVFVTQTDLVINHAIGKVTFNTAIGASDVVRASAGKYFTKTQVARAKEWSLDIERNVEEDTEFGSAWESNLPILGKGSGSVKLNYANSTWFTQITSATPRLVLALFVDYTALKSYEFTALLSKQGIGASVKGLLEEELNFTSSGFVNYVDR